MNRWAALVFGVWFVVATTPMWAQEPERVVVTVAAPVFMKPDVTITPLRLAKEGSVLKIVASEGDWYRVEFEDPQLGRRLGYIQKRHVRTLAPEPSSMQAVDLTVAEARPQPAAVAVPVSQPLSSPPSSSTIPTYPAADTAIGWGILRDSTIEQTSMLGWNVSGAGNLTPWLAVVGDVGGNYKTLNDTLGATLKVHTFLSGVRVTGRFGDGRVTPFGQFLAGLALSNGSILGFSESTNDFAIQPGGGVDIRLSDSVAVRMQVDFRTIFSEGARFNEFRFMPGIVLRSGWKVF